MLRLKNPIESWCGIGSVGIDDFNKVGDEADRLPVRPAGKVGTALYAPGLTSYA